MAVSDGNGWVDCTCGGRHWGRNGAAGMFLVAWPESPDPRLPLPDEALVLLQHRALWSHEGGTWGLPGGARDSHENSVETAVREAMEETGIDASQATVLGTLHTDHGNWSYDTIVMYVDHTPEPISNHESEELRWVPVSDIEALPLHSGFAAALPRLTGPPAEL